VNPYQPPPRLNAPQWIRLSLLDSPLRSVLGPLRAVLILALLIGGWELYADLGPVDPLLLPAPHAVATALVDDRALLWSNFTVTAGEVLLGILVAAAAGLACAIVLHLSLSLRRSVYPLLVASQTIPIPIVAALLVVWLGFDLAPKLVIIGLVSFFPIAVTTLDALARVDPELLKLLRTLDAPRLRVLRHVELPAALPGVFSGAKIGVAVAVIGAVFAEQAGSSAGLGHLVQQAIPQLLTARAYAAVLILSAFAIALFGLLTLAERLVLPWTRNPPGGTNG
jgi:ABC-type nitrate/sulfonate/bicarbonate transport system permease component